MAASRRALVSVTPARALPRGANESVQQTQTLTEVFRSETSGEVEKSEQKIGVRRLAAALDCGSSLPRRRQACAIL